MFKISNVFKSRGFFRIFIIWQKDSARVAIEETFVDKTLNVQVSQGFSLSTESFVLKQ